MKKPLILFDFDGTLTTKDTFLEFIKSVKGKVRFGIGFFLLSPLLVAMKLGLIPNWKAKEVVLTYFFGGMETKSLETQAKQFTIQTLPKLIRKGVLPKIKSYKEQGAHIIIITASAELWVKPWADSMGIDVLGTRLATKNGKITGHIRGKNCYGPEKARRLSAYLDTEEYHPIHAYGDSRGDREMLKIADQAFYKPFRSS